jgi:hypothetical protein
VLVNLNVNLTRARYLENNLFMTYEDDDTSDQEEDEYFDDD